MAVAVANRVVVGFVSEEAEDVVVVVALLPPLVVMTEELADECPLELLVVDVVNEVVGALAALQLPVTVTVWWWSLVTVLVTVFSPWPGGGGRFHPH